MVRIARMVTVVCFVLMCSLLNKNEPPTPEAQGGGGGWVGK